MLQWPAGRWCPYVRPRNRLVILSHLLHPLESTFILVTVVMVVVSNQVSGAKAEGRATYTHGNTDSRNHLDRFIPAAILIVLALMSASDLGEKLKQPCPPTRTFEVGVHGRRQFQLGN